MQSVDYTHFRAAVCDDNRCWQNSAIAEAGVTAEVGDGWRYFLSEKHYKSVRCVGREGRLSKMCDAIAVSTQTSQKKLVFLELKASGKYSDAIGQLRAGADAILSHGVPKNVVLIGEIWHRRDPKSPIRGHRICEVAGRKIFVRHRKSA